MAVKKPISESIPVARSEDGGIEINLVIPFSEIDEAREAVLTELAKETEIPGFRKGKAPLSKVKEKVSATSVIEKTLIKVVPKRLASVISENKIRPATYPKLELVSAQEGESWQVKVTTCEIPAVELGDYKALVGGAIRAASLKRELVKEEKEQVVISALVEGIKPKIPKLLVEEEVNARLSSLLSRLEKLGLKLESYLASVGKTPESLREEYQKGARDALSLDIILSAIAEAENVKVEEKDIDAAVSASQTATKSAEVSQEQRSLVRAILRRKAVLDSLASLG